MAHELLEDVLRTSDAGGRARRRHLMPLSIALHAAAIAALLLVPLVADNELMPGLARAATRYVSAVPTPPTPPGPPPPKGPVANADRAAAPLAAAADIAPERPVPVTTASDPAGVPSIGPPGDPSGLDFGGIGTAASALAVPPPPPPREPVRIGGVIREPKKIVDVPPVYPPFAIAARKEGVVIMEAMIDERGNVVRVRVLRSEPLLDAAAVSAVERWRYTPTLLNNQPVPVLMTVTVRFSLR